jgi:hypothetical protein
MARRPRVHFAGAFYHVIAQGNKGQKVFRKDEDYRLYLRLLSRVGPAVFRVGPNAVNLTATPCLLHLYGFPVVVSVAPVQWLF